MPRMPSLPITIRSGDGPAPLPASAAIPKLPAGVTIRTDSTKSSMCVYGSSRNGRRSGWRSNSRASRTRSSAGSGAACSRAAAVAPPAPDPGLPPGSCAAREVSSTSSTWSNRVKSMVQTLSASGGSTPATTVLPPPYGIATMFELAHQSNTRAASSSVRGYAITSGGLGNSHLNPRMRSRKLRPYVCAALSWSSMVQNSATSGCGVKRGLRRLRSASVGGVGAGSDTPYRPWIRSAIAA